MQKTDVGRVSYAGGVVDVFVDVVVAGAVIAGAVVDGAVVVGIPFEDTCRDRIAIDAGLLPLYRPPITTLPAVLSVWSLVAVHWVFLVTNGVY